MRALIQRVKEAEVRVSGEQVGAIEQGLLVFLAVQKGDDESKADKLLHKVMHYRVFGDDAGKMNLDVQQIGGGLLVVSQFTLAADTQKGLRPSFSCAAEPARAEALYDYFVARARNTHPVVATGEFAADMKVSLVNDGPVTFMLEVN